ncbi:MAG TPA: metal-dependent hydrolase, partial [Serratia marcescens]|nr:metal-dependent hydrolase [Serratia marcescens]
MSYAFTDTHCHFDFPPFTGHEAESLTRAASAGVQRIIVPTVTADRFARVLRLAQDHAPLFAALGLHPLYIAQHHEPQLEQLAALLAE